MQDFPFESQAAKALRYVQGGHIGQPETSGQFQFQLLKDHGLQPEHRVLEFGAGCLLLGHHLIEYLEEWHYCAVEPNEWLVDAGLNIWGAAKTFHRSPSEHFSASGVDALSDYIYSHSVLSHAASAQLPSYMAAVKMQLKPGGTALASLHIGEVNTNSPTWVYPGVTTFTKDTVVAEAAYHGLQVQVRPDIRAAFMDATADEHHHNWIELRHA